jgi:uncharacterized Zn-binding protein involved in type VI secretion
LEIAIGGWSGAYIASNPTKKVNGKAVVLEGDKASCGATFIANQSMGEVG